MLDDRREFGIGFGRCAPRLSLAPSLRQQRGVVDRDRRVSRDRLDDLLGLIVKTAGLVMGDEEAPMNCPRTGNHRDGEIAHDGQMAFGHPRSEEHTSELPQLMRHSNAFYCMK